MAVFLDNLPADQRCFPIRRGFSKMRKDYGFLRGWNSGDKFNIEAYCPVGDVSEFAVDILFGCKFQDFKVNRK